MTSPIRPLQGAGIARHLLDDPQHRAVGDLGESGRAGHRPPRVETDHGPICVVGRTAGLTIGTPEVSFVRSEQESSADSRARGRNPASARRRLVAHDHDSRAARGRHPTAADWATTWSGWPRPPRRRYLPADFMDLFAPAALRRRPARSHRVRAPRDRRRGHHRDPPRRRLGRPRARPVPPHRHRRRRRTPVARLLADPRPAPRRPHLDHRQGRPRRPGQQPPRPPRRARHPGAPRAGGRRVRPPARGRQVPHGDRRLGHHAGHRHAAQPLPEHRRRRAPPGPQRASTTSSWSTSRRATPTRSSSATSRRSTPPARSAWSRGTTTSTACSTSTTSPTWCPTSPSGRRSPAAPPACSTPSAPTTRRPGITLTTEQFRTARVEPG